MKKVKLGIIGCGWAGRQGALAVKEMEDAEIYAIADLFDSIRDKFGDEFAVPHRYTDYRELLANKEIEAVYIATNPDIRLPMVLDSLQAGKHILLQKPHALHAEDILEMEKHIQFLDQTLMFCFFNRHFPNRRYQMEQIKAGALGDPYHARIFIQYNHLPVFSKGTRWLVADGYMGGVFGQNTSHELNYAWWMMGRPNPEWAFAIRHSPYTKYDGPEGPAEDYFSGLIGFEGGKTIQVECSRMLHVQSNTYVEIYGTEGAYSGGIYHFKDGKFEMDPIKEVLPPDVPMSIFTKEEEPIYLYHELRDFIYTVQGKRTTEVDSKEAYVFTKMMSALYESSRTQEKIFIK